MAFVLPEDMPTIDPEDRCRGDSGANNLPGVVPSKVVPGGFVRAGTGRDLDFGGRGAKGRCDVQASSVCKGTSEQELRGGGDPREVGHVATAVQRRAADAGLRLADRVLYDRG